MAIISVIVPVYKVEPYLRRCVDSILNQTFTDFELILVDDGSPDGCPAICDEYAAKDNRVKVIHKENGGLSSARNAGLDIATGEFVLFVDSDDYIALETLEKTMETAQRTDSDMVIFDFAEVFDDAPTPRRAPNTFAHEEEWSWEKFWQYCYSGFGSLCAISCNKLMGKSLFEGIRYEEGRLHEDEFIIYDIVNASTKIVFLNEPLYFYYRHKESITGHITIRNRLDSECALLNRAVAFSKNGAYLLAMQTIWICMQHYVRDYSSGMFSKKEKRQLTKQCAIIRKVYLGWYCNTQNKRLYVSEMIFKFSPRVYFVISQARHLFKNNK